MTQPPYPPVPGPYGPPQGPPPGWQPSPPGWGPPAGPPPGPPQGPGTLPAPPGPPPRKRSTGKVLAIVAVVLVLLLGLGGFAMWKLASRITGSAGALAGGSGPGCSAVSDADVDAVLGGRWDVVQLGGAIGGLAAPVLDARVLPDAQTTCWAVEDKAGKLARIARYQGPDAAQRFAAEKQKAKGSTEDRGNGLSVSTSGYLGKDARAGDEAFCTTGDMTASAGALVRRGDTLVYVSTTAAGEGADTVPDISFDGAGLSFGTDQANCDLAVKLVEKVH